MAVKGPIALATSLAPWEKESQMAVMTWGHTGSARRQRNRWVDCQAALGGSIRMEMTPGVAQWAQKHSKRGAPTHHQMSHHISRQTKLSAGVRQHVDCAAAGAQAPNFKSLVLPARPRQSRLPHAHAPPCPSQLRTLCAPYLQVLERVFRTATSPHPITHAPPTTPPAGT